MYTVGVVAGVAIARQAEGVMTLAEMIAENGAPKRNLTHVPAGEHTLCGLPIAEARALDTTPTLRKMTCSWCRVALHEARETLERGERL